MLFQYFYEKKYLKSQRRWFSQLSFPAYIRYDRLKVWSFGQIGKSWSKGGNIGGLKLADYFAAARLTGRYHLLAQIFGHPCWISSFRLAAFRPHRSFFRRASHSEIGVWKKGVRERVWTSCTLVRLNSTVLVGRLVITQSGRRSLVTSCFPANSTSAAAADPRDFSTRENEISTIHYYPAALLYCYQRSVSIRSLQLFTREIMKYFSRY